MNKGQQLRLVWQCNPELVIAYGAVCLAAAMIGRGAAKHTNLLMSLPALVDEAAHQVATGAPKVVPINGA